MTATGIGIVGAGAISSAYLETLTRCPDVEVLMIADLDVDRAGSRASEFNVPRSGTLEELLDADDVDVIVNLTIPAAHASVSTAALESGKHVWTEKPLATSLGEGATVLAAAERAGLRIAGAPDTFLGPGQQTVRSLVDGGRIGTPISGLAILQSPGPDAWHPSPEFLFARGGGPLMDMGPYYIAALVQVLGPIDRVAALASRPRAVRTIGSGPRTGMRFPVEVPTTVSALLHFAGGTQAQLLVSFDSLAVRSGFLEFSGTAGTLVAPDPNTFGGDVELRGAEPQTISTTATTGRGTGVIDLVRSIRQGAPERASGALAYHVLEVLTAISASAESGSFELVSSRVDPSPPLPSGWDALRPMEALAGR